MCEREVKEWEKTRKRENEAERGRESEAKATRNVQLYTISVL